MNDPPSPPEGKRARKSRLERAEPLEVKRLHAPNIQFKPVEECKQNIPALSYGLDRALFNPGVYQIQDARSQVFNFDPYLTTIMPVEQFDFDALKAYITSSKDTKLRELADKYGLKYCGSTSSMTSILSHFHFLLSAWRKPNFSMISRSLEPESPNYTRLTRSPAAAYARLTNGVYAIDADKEFDGENVLSMLGKSMEKLLTLPREEFEKYRRTRSHLITEEERNADEAYHYTTLGDFLMRSQLDARDPRLPGTGVFDLKTRAVVSIRMAIDDHVGRRGYEIKTRFGKWESFEREYYDMIRSAFLKYSLQVRMGRMDGIFLAYHNTQRIFGFQYIPLEEMDQAIHGTSDRDLGDQEFKISVSLLNDLMNRATERFPGRSLRIHVETRDTKVPVMYFFAEPVDDNDITASQEAAKRSVDAVQAKVMSLRAGQQEKGAEEVEEEEAQTAAPDVDVDAPAESATTDEDSSGGQAWEDLMSTVEKFVEDDSQGAATVKEALQDALEEAHVLRHKNEESEMALDDLVEALMAESMRLKEARETDEAATTTSPSSDGGIESPAEGAVGGQSQEPEGTLFDSTGEVSAQESGKRSTSRQDTMKELFIQLAKEARNGRTDMGPFFERAVAKLAAQAKAEEASDSAVEDQEADPSSIAEAEEGLGTTIDEQGTGATPAAEPSDESTVLEERSSMVDGGELSEVPVEELQAVEDTTAGVEGELAAAEDESQTSTARQEKPEPKPKNKKDKKAQAEPGKKERELMGLYLTIRNKVDGEVVARPIGRRHFNWTVEYTVTEMPDRDAQRIYPMVRNRRMDALSNDRTKKADNAYQNRFQELLKDMSKRGEKYREALEQAQKGKDVYVAWDEKPLPPKTRTQGMNVPPSDD